MTATVVDPEITMFKENGMANNKKKQQQKKKMRDFKKKKSDQAKLEQARNADPAEKEDRKRASTSRAARSGRRACNSDSCCVSFASRAGVYGTVRC